MFYVLSFIVVVIGVLLQLRLSSQGSTFEDCKAGAYSVAQPTTLKHRRNCRGI